MYLKLTNDHTATFYNNDAMNDESKEVSFKFNPCHYPDPDFSFCFEADITDDLRNFLKQFCVLYTNFNFELQKLQFYLFSNGNIGPCSKR